MKNSTVYTAFMLAIFMSMLSSCSVVTGIFKTGMGVGIFVSVLIVVGIIALIMRSGNKN